MKFFISVLVIVLPGVNSVIAQSMPEPAEIFIEQPGSWPERYANGYTGAGLQLEGLEKNRDELRFSDQDTGMISDSGQIGAWEVLLPASSDYGLCVWLDQCQDISFNQFPDSLHAGQILSNEKMIEGKAGSTRMDELEEFLAKDDDVAIEAFRKAFKAVLEEKENEDETASVIRMEIDGLVHDETRSKVGREFYDLFYSEWEPPPYARNYSIRVMETPSPNPGTKVFVKVNQEEIFRIQLQPGGNRLEDAGKYAVQQTYAHLEENNNNLVIY